MKNSLAAFFCILCLVSSIANASITISLEEFTCSGSFLSESPDTNISCSGDLRLVGGNIKSTDELFITSVGSVYIRDVIFDAVRAINITSNSLTMEGGITVHIDGYGFPPLSSNEETMIRGLDVQLPPNSGFVIAVPEPETYLLMLAGLSFLGFIARRRSSSVLFEV